MQFANKYKYLSFSDTEGRYGGLEVIDGNPRAVRGNSNRSPPDLSLAWQREGILAERRPRADERGSNPLPVQNPGLWERFRNHADAIAVIITIIFAALGVTWYLSKYDSRLEGLEKIVSEPSGLVEQVRDIGKDITEIQKDVAQLEATAKLIEKYILPQIFQSKATALLGTADIGIFRVVNNEITTDARFSAPYKDPSQGPSPQKETYMTYTMEGIKDGFLFLRMQLEEEEGGKVVRTLYDRRVQIGLPTEVGKPDNTCLKLKANEGSFETPPFCIDVVLVERIGPNNLVYASAVKTEGTS